MIHPVRSQITAAARAFADSRGTSDEVAQAIFNIAEDDTDANRIWEDCSPTEEAAIMREAWRLASDDTDILFWGYRRERPQP